MQPVNSRQSAAGPCKPRRRTVPAPRLVPTIASTPAPRPNASGYSRYSRRAAMPKPASARRPKRADKAGEHRERKIVEDRLQRHRGADAQDFDEQRRLSRTSRNDSLMAVRPDAMYQASAALDALNDTTVAMPAPVIRAAAAARYRTSAPAPARCAGPRPQVDHGQNGGVARAAHDARQCAEHPVGDRTGEERVRVFERSGKDIA